MNPTRLVVKVDIKAEVFGLQCEDLSQKINRDGKQRAIQHLKLLRMDCIGCSKGKKKAGRRKREMYKHRERERINSNSVIK